MKLELFYSLLIFKLTFISSTYAAAPAALKPKTTVIKLTEQGVSPSSLKISGDNGVVFFLNASPSAEAKLQIDFGKKRVHCAGTNMQMLDDGKVISTKPFGPRDFATTCFHDPGKYKFTAYGLKAFPQGAHGVIEVE